MINKEFIDDLIKDTKFQVASEGSLMTGRQKVRTPLVVLNALYGGGLPLSVIEEVSGPPSSGKSTFLYQTLANFQKDFEDGIGVIYDTELSMDNNRLKSLGVDVNKVLRLPCGSIQEVFNAMFTMANKLTKAMETNPNICTFQVYDSISSGGTDKQQESAHSGTNVFNAGSMMETPRIIKQNLANILPYLEKLPMNLGLINQVITSGIGTYQVKVQSGGGFGLKHFTSAHIIFGNPKDIYNDKGFIIATQSSVTLGKSRLGPKIINVPVVLNVTDSGKIHEIDSFVQYLVQIEKISTGAWYNIKNTINSICEHYPETQQYEEIEILRNKNYRQGDLYQAIRDDKDLYNLLQIDLIDFFNEIYPQQALINSEYKANLMADCKYLKSRSQETLDKLNDLIEKTKIEQPEQEEQDEKKDKKNKK